MHRFPNRTRLDGACIEGSDQFIARAAEFLLVEEKATQPIDVQSVGRLGHERYTGKIREGVVIAERDRPSLLDTLAEYFQLASPNARQNIAQAIVIADVRVLVPKAGIPCLLLPDSR